MGQELVADVYKEYQVNEPLALQEARELATEKAKSVSSGNAWTLCNPTRTTFTKALRS
jgi:hypothetical protein